MSNDTRRTRPAARTDSARPRASAGTVLARVAPAPRVTSSVRLPRELPDSVRRDVLAPPPLLLLPLRLEYRVVETNVPINVAGSVAALLRANAGVTVHAPATPGAPATPPRRRAPAVPAQPWRLDVTRVSFTTQREIWFRWYPDEDFTLHGIAPPSPEETAALARFYAACGGKEWYAVDDAAVVSAWQVMSREVAPERALHLIRHRGDPGDPDYLDKLGRIALLPEKVALFALDAAGALVPLAEGNPIDSALRYSIANLQAGGWHTDFDMALKAGMAVRLTSADAVRRALGAAWIIAVGLAKDEGAAALTSLLDDALANGNFEFLRQGTATNNTPSEPTPYQAPRADLVGFLQSAAAAEKGVLASPLTQSAEVFAEALGLDLRHVATAPNSGDLALEDARAMLRVIGPALIDTAVDHTAALRGLEEEEVIEFFAQSIVARGALPAVRFGKSPYGILPVVKLDGLAALDSDGDTDKRIEAFVRDFASVVGKESQVVADRAVPVLQPGDAAAATKLEAILRLNPVSRRLEVGTVGPKDVRALGCAYVTNTVHPVEQYLAELARVPLGDLPDPTASDASYPLLYRLARLSLSKKTILTVAVSAPALASVKVSTRVQLTPDEQSKFDAATVSVARRSLISLAAEGVTGAPAVRVASGRFLAALQRLQAIAAEPDGAAGLEMLLMETIDLFQHRIDAWVTGLAYRRLVRRRRAGRAGLVGGYWGLLGRLRADSVTGRTDGYLQAPSPHQAATAAILRSAHLRHRDTGAFAIGLDSVRVRRGLELLEILQAGISPGEALGYIAERKLHERHQDILIFRLRDLFPVRDPRDEAAIETRLSDGLAFLNADIAKLVAASEVAPLTALQNDLRQHFDTLSDIVLAEATHQRAMGQAEAAKAWLQVLSGETIPGVPSVLRTRRSGHGSTHRVLVVIDPVEAAANAAPRAIAEPALAALVAAFLHGFNSAFVKVTIVAVDGGQSATLQFTLAADLGLTPIDLLIGGDSEVVLRARHRLVTLWREDAATQAELGPLPDRDIVSYINRTRPVTIDLGEGATSTRSLIDEAAELRRVVAQGRRLEPSDLSAAADPAVPLTDSLERDLLVKTSQALAARATLLASRMGADLAALRSATGPVVAAARNSCRLNDEQAEADTLALALAHLQTLRRTLDAKLLAVSHYTEPAALRPIATGEMVTNPDELERALAALVARLSTKVASLTSALAPATPANASAARAQRDALIAALKSALDGDALLLIPPVQRIAATTPLLEPGPPRVASALAEWQQVRAKVARITKLFAALPWRAYATSAAATGADDAEADARTDESIAPRARLFATLVSKSDPAAVAMFAGFVADEWAEQRPSRVQQTGLAINYDSPQSEPPHVLILGEPAGPGAASWSPQSAAAMVAETIGLMKARALTAQDRPLPGPLFPFANQVPFKQQLPLAAPQPRIPVQRFRAVVPGALGGDSAFVVDATTREVGVAGLFEIAGSAKVKE